MRRFVQVMTLMLAILAGSLGGYASAARGRDLCPCCGTTLADLSGLDGCRMPGRAPNPSDPCTLEAAPVSVALAAPLQAIALPSPDGRLEPSPLPLAMHLPFPIPSPPAGAQRGRRPNPPRTFQPGHDPMALLSVFLI